MLPALGSLLLAPALDFSTVLAPGARPGDHVAIFLDLVNGQVEETGVSYGPRSTPQDAADMWAWHVGIRHGRYRQDGLRVTVYEWSGIAVVGIRVTSLLPSPTVRWVPRATRPAPALVRLTPRGNTLGLLGVARAPEVDFADIPVPAGQPRVFHLWLTLDRADGRVATVVIGCTRGVTPAELAEAASREFEARGIGYLQRGPARLSVLDHEGVPVNGIAIESSGPVPRLGWAIRPGLRGR
ncbi:MAG: hypothetical protein K2P78_04415 [Gemmataceae bacterium]|nr:hypothetical protein [Gemmataceae bacterium]